jgi:hypothetical protein
MFVIWNWWIRMVHKMTDVWASNKVCEKWMQPIITNVLINTRWRFNQPIENNMGKLADVHSVRPNPPPLSVRSPSSGFGLTFLRGIGLGLGWVLWWLKCPIPCLVRASPRGYSPFPFTIGHLYLLWVLELFIRLACRFHDDVQLLVWFYSFISFI